MAIFCSHARTLSYTVPATVFIEEDVKVSTQRLGTFSYLQYQLPDEGMTLHLRIIAGRVVLYTSTTMHSPNSAFYDIRLETQSDGDVFISPEQTVTGGGGIARDMGSNLTTIFITIEGLLENNSYVLETTFGDTSTCKNYINGSVRSLCSFHSTASGIPSDSSLTLLAFKTVLGLALAQLYILMLTH